MSDNPIAPALSDDAYDALLTGLRAIITTGRGRAAAAVNAELVMTYWKIGERIVREEQGGAARAAYGTQLLARLGRILSGEYGRGFTETSLQNMRRFYLAYPISSALRRELTWSSYRVLMRLPSRSPSAIWKRRSWTTSRSSCLNWAAASASSAANSGSPSGTRITTWTWSSITAT